MLKGFLCVLLLASSAYASYELRPLPFLLKAVSPNDHLFPERAFEWFFNREARSK